MAVGLESEVMIGCVNHLELIRLLVGREITLRYKRSVLGAVVDAYEAS